MAAVVTDQTRGAVFTTRDANGEGTVEETFKRLAPGGNFMSVDAMNTALILPWPFNHLLARGKWQSISLLISSRWPRGCSIMPVVQFWRRFELADVEPDAVVEDVDEDAEANLIQPQMFQNLADFLRDRADLIARGADTPEDERANIEMYVKWLERCVEGCSQEAVETTMVETRTGRGGRWFPHLGRRVQYFSDFFIKVICFTCDVRNDNSDGSYVGRVFRKTIRLLPPQMKQLLEEMYKSQVFPSPATVSRANLFLDVAFMRIMAERHEQLVGAVAIFFGLSDASPQGGRLYQISEYYCFGGTDGKFLVEAGNAALRLKSFSKRPEVITDDDLKAMTELMDIVRSAKSLHALPPTCMDSKNSGAAVRGHCFIHQLRLESSSWQLTADLCQLFFSFTLDSGPEKGLRRLYLPNLDSLAYWRPIQLEKDDCDDLDALAEPVSADPVISLTHIFDVAGIFHIVDNMEKRMLMQIPSFQDHKKGFESVVVCYHRPYLRKRFVSLCLTSSSEEEKGLFDVSVPNLEGGRVWTVVSRICNFLGERERLIRDNWDPDQMSSGVADADEEIHTFKDTGAHVQRADDAIGQPSFWSMVALVRHFSNWLAALMYWAQSCPCHSRALRDFFDMDLRDLDCPLRGCRAPCIAAGELDKFNERLAENARQEIVLIQQREDLTPAERAQVMDEFAVGREYIQTEFSIRLSTGWSSIPLKALVLGHQDFEREIIPGLIACLMQFESIPPEQYAELSEVTLTLFARGGAVREQILCLIRRTHTFDQLPAVLRIRIAAAQLPVAEVSIERRHAAIHAGTRSTPNHTIQYDSVHGLRKKKSLPSLKILQSKYRRCLEPSIKTPGHPLNASNLSACRRTQRFEGS